ncbi:MAG: hypothetical protein Q4A25_01975 [Candidatus Saccharibacteria bacterium]|nr:hypothetical protein [Candidatus Saccharibacteria bacterium]
MKKTQKRLLGIGGLALVAVITAIAYHIPDAGAMTASASVDVTVSVVGSNPEVKINSPLDGAKLTNANLKINVAYADADAIQYILSDGMKSVVIPSPELAPNATKEHGSYGTHDFTYNLKDFDRSKAGYGNYTLRVLLTREGSTAEDSVSFSYVPATVNEGKTPVDENNNPIVDLNVKPSVVKVEAVVYDKDGKEIFRGVVDTNGKDKVYMTLPFYENYAQDGKYTVKFITYSYNWYNQLVADQTLENTKLITEVTYHAKKSDDSNPNNPVIDIDVEEGVEVVEIIVYDKDGKEIFRIKVPVTDLTTNHIELPFDKYGLKDGEYIIAIIPYVRDENGNLIPLITEEEAKKNAIKITYGSAPSPEVPDTGSFFAYLNLSEKDFLLTGLVIFAAVTAGGIFILRKKETRR